MTVLTVPAPLVPYVDADGVEQYAGPGFTLGGRLLGLRDKDMVGIEIADDAVATGHHEQLYGHARPGQLSLAV